MKRFTKFALVILPIMLVTDNSHATLKPGTACKKSGQVSVSSGKKYTCIKKGKSLIWSVSKKDTKPTQKNSPITTPTLIKFEPWSLNFDASIMVAAAKKKTDLYFGKVIPSSDYELIMDPLITKPDQTWITKILDYVNGAFSPIKESKVKVYLGTTHKWSLDTLRSRNSWIGDPSTPFPCSQGTWEVYCADKDSVLLIFSEIYKRNPNFVWNANLMGVPAHEMFHVVQYWLYGDMNYVSPESSIAIPIWLKEGSANYFGQYINEILGIENYFEGRNRARQLYPNYRDKIPLINYNSYSQGTAAYGIGQVATEYIIASVGFKSLLDIFKFTKEEGNFAAGFKRATQIELSDFYNKFEAARGFMQLGQ
jgi:hypothetical protein